ncbi:MAG: ferrous iron transport protein B [Acidobacteriota bacterium]|nr:MAG: ferrous iron transport protein B [Acidobacteriota bacterium]
MSPTARAAAGEQPESRVLLAGNPNVGKSVIFGLLTGRYAIVSNYPGTTVEVARGEGTLNRRRVTVVDTPGINSLLPTSEDERVARDILLAGGCDAVVQVADSKNLSRALLLTLELGEMGLPVVLALNMADEARSRGIEIDARRLGERLGVPVVSTVAVERKGVGALVAALPDARVPRLSAHYPKPIEEALRQAEETLPFAGGRRAVAAMALAGDETLAPWLKKNLSPEARLRLAGLRTRMERRYDEPVASLLHRARLEAVERLAAEYVVRSGKVRASGPAARLGAAAMHPVYGLGVLALVLAGMWLFVGGLGAGVLVGLLENTLFGKFINPAAVWLFERLAPWALVRELFVGEFGLITMGVTYSVAIILPIVATFFLAFGILEDSGYLARLALMMNRLFRLMGLNGKAVLPMVLGLGCDTMATMTTRILETRRERLITTLLLVLAVPCSAQLGVIAAMMAVLPLPALFLWLAVVLGVLVSVGWLAARVLPGKGSDFVLEVPPMRRPTLSNIAVKTLGRVEWYLKEAVPLFLIGTAIVFAFDKLRVLGFLREAGAPVVQSFLGLPAAATDAFVMGFLRRDFGAAGLFVLLEKGALGPAQALVAIVVITLFVPCVANFLMAIKELGLRAGVLIAMFVFPLAVAVGGAVRAMLHATGWLGG